MKKIIAALAVLGGLNIGLVMAEQADTGKSEISTPFKEGVDYSLLAEKQADGGDKIEVIEFFSYACPHCQTFEPYVSDWEKRKPANVKLTLVPVSFNPGWEAMAKTYYATQAMGIVGKTHAAIFSAIHKDKKPAATAEQIADIIEPLGVDRKKFLDNMNSFSMETNLRRSKQLAAKYRISGVPSVAVNGRYMSSGTMAGGYPSLITLIDYLIGEEAKRLQDEKKVKKKEPSK